MRKINITGSVREHEPLAPHTSFRVGGPADLYAVPADEEDVVRLLAFARQEGVPYFVLGGGANIVISDLGVRGLVIDTGGLAGIRLEGDLLVAGAGLPVSDAAAFAARRALGGLEFIYSMPGSVGGAVWMNARCYDGEIAAILAHVDLVTDDLRRERYLPAPGDFSYKRSPFMARTSVMTSAAFRLHPAPEEELWRRMRENEEDRRTKGHFDAPCAGSIFKNNRAFGRPSGAIIDSLGLKGLRVGGAQVSERHANIIINTGSATASDIRDLVRLVHDRVLEEVGFDLEEEVLFVGQWEV